MSTDSINSTTTDIGFELDPGLDAMLDDALAHWPFGGGVLVVVVADKVTVRPFGKADIAAEIPVNPSHRFEIGSISKIFTSLLINQLIDEHLFELDTPVADLLPWFVPPRGAGTITVRHLLNHTAGLVGGLESPTGDLEQAWALRDTDAVAPGEFFNYSNPGYTILGLIVTAATGLTLSDALRTRLFQPAGMTSAIPEITHADRQSLAVGYGPLRDDTPYLPSHPLVPATWFEMATGDGNIAADGADMGQFLRVLLNGGSIDGRTVISPQSFDRVVETLAPNGPGALARGRHVPVISSRYGLGLNVEVTAAGRHLAHSGGMVGYVSYLLADIDRGIGVVVLTSATGGTPIAELIARDVHAHQVNRQAGLAVEGVTLLDPSIWDIRAEIAGHFVSGKREITLEFVPSGELVLSSNGTSARLLWTLNDRCASEHPHFSLFHLVFESDASGPRWVYGDEVFRHEEAAMADTPVGTGEFTAFTGHYRAHSPWFTNFRVLARDGHLYLSAATGVEAPRSDQQLVQLSPARFRVGADPRLPERLTFGPVVDGVSIWAERDGCRYSRTFTP